MAIGSDEKSRFNSEDLKRLTARELFRRHPEVKKILWGGTFWSSGYFVNTVGKSGDGKTISEYVRNQGMEKDYDVLHVNQLTLF